MAIYCNDTYTGAAGDLSLHNPDSTNAGTTWTVDLGGSGGFNLDGSGKIQGPADSTDHVYLSPGVPGSADYDVSVDVTYDGSATTTAIGVAGRAIGSSYYNARYNAGGFWEAYCFAPNVGGAGINYLELGTHYTQTLTTGQPYRLTLRMTGTAITLLVDDVARVTATNSTLSSAGSAGVSYFATTGAAYKLDNFTLSDIGSATPTAPTVTLTEYTPAHIVLSRTNPSGGTGTLTTQWHASTNLHATTGVGTALSGETGSTLTYIPSDPDSIVWFWNVVTDANPSTAESSRVSASLAAHDPLCLLCVGTSWTYRTPPGGTSMPDWLASLLPKMNGTRMVSVVNAGVGASSTNDWAVGSTNLNNALSAGASAYAAMPSGTVKWCHFEHGFNDAEINSPSTFGSQSAAILAELISNGWKIIFPYPSFNHYSGPVWTSTQMDSGNANALAYQAVIDGLCDNVNIFRGATALYKLIGQHPEYSTDDLGVHLNALGTQYASYAWAEGIIAAIDKPASIASVITDYAF